MTNWISCEERLPQEEEEVIVHLDIRGEEFVTTAKWYDWEWHFGGNGCLMSQKAVKNWMPLPLPPEGK